MTGYSLPGCQNSSCSLSLWCIWIMGNVRSPDRAKSLHAWDFTALLSRKRTTNRHKQKLRNLFDRLDGYRLIRGSNSRTALSFMALETECVYVQLLTFVCSNFSSHERLCYTTTVYRWGIKISIKSFTIPQNIVWNETAIRRVINNVSPKAIMYELRQNIYYKTLYLSTSWLKKAQRQAWCKLSSTAYLYFAISCPKKVLQ